MRTMNIARKALLALMATSIVAVLSLGLAGCSSTEDPDEITVAWTSNMGDHSLDPANNYMGWQGSYLGIYEQLFRIDGNFEIQPMIAESAEQVDDDTWKITIKEGITFQNGDPCDATAVAASLERAADENPRAAKALDAKDISADGQTLTIVTNKPNMAYINELAEPVFSIIDVAGTQSTDMPVGTGAYKIESVDDNGNVELSAYESYWQGAPSIKTVHAQYITDDQSKVNALQTGEIKAAMNIAPDQLANFTDESKYSLFQTNQGRVHMLYFNMNSETMSDPLVRKAVASCVDRSGYVDSLYDGAAEVTQGAFPASSGYSEGVTATQYDLDQAKQLLAQAGWADTDGDGYLDKDGEKLHLNLVTYEANAALPKMCEALSSTLKQVGIEASVEVAEKIGDRLNQDGWDVGTMAYNVLPTGDPYTYLSSVMYTGAASNYGNYSNAKVDELIDQLKLASDPDERKNIVEQIQQIALDDCAYVYVVHALSSDITAANVVNLQMNGQYDWLNYKVAYK